MEEEGGDIYESIEELWPDYPTEEDYLWNEDEYCLVSPYSYKKVSFEAFFLCNFDSPEAFLHEIRETGTPFGRKGIPGAKTRPGIRQSGCRLYLPHRKGNAKQELL